MGSAGPGEESPQQTGTKGSAEKLAGEARVRGRGGQRSSGGGGAQAGPLPAVPHCPGCRRPLCPGLPPPRACPRRPPRLLRFRAAAARSRRGSLPPRVPSRPLLSFIKLPRAAGPGGETTVRVNRATDVALAAREVRGPVRAQFSYPLAHPATHPLRPGAGGPGWGTSPQTLPGVAVAPQTLD